MRVCRTLPGLPLLALGLVLSCTEGESPAELAAHDRLRLSLVPSYNAVAGYTGLAVNRVRLTVTNTQTNQPIPPTPRVFTVSPDSSRWDLSLDLELPAAQSVTVVILIELLHDPGTGSPASVEWSGRTNPLPLSLGAPQQVANVPLYQGPSANLDVRSVRISPDPVSPILEGATTQLAAAVDGPPGSTVAWTSLDPTLAGVGPAGLVTGLLPGEARIVAIAGPKADTVVVPVRGRPARVDVSPGAPTLASLGQEVVLAARVLDARGAELSGHAVTWSVASGSAVEQVAGGRFRARANGTSTVRAVVDGFAAATGAATITVAQQAASVSVSPGSATLASLGATQQLVAVARDANGNTIVGAGVTWSSSNPGVATVSSSGLVSAAANGSATITATSGSTSGSASITVAQTAATVVVSPSSVSFSSLGATQQLGAVARDANGNAIAGASVTWSTSDPGVARVSSSGLVTAVGNGGARITAASGGATGTSSVAVSQVPARLTLSPSAVTFSSLGTTQQLAARVEDANANAIASAEVSWATSNGGVASVSSSGRVTAVANGSATITATSGGASGTSRITVDQVPASVTMSPAGATLASLGATQQLTATVRDANDQAITGASVTWSTSNSGIATVSSSGLVTAVANGSATITAASGALNGSARVTVSQVATRVDPEQPSHVFTALGTSHQCSAVVTDANGHVIAGASITWTSSNSAVASVSSSGLVTAAGNGTATVTAASGAAAGLIQVSVAQAASSVSISPSSAALTSAGSTQQLTATVKDANGSTMSGAPVTWTSSDTGVATVSSGGLVTAVGAGGATITATSGTVSATAVITVTQTAARVVISPSSVSLNALGATQQLTASVQDANGNALAGQPVTWASRSEYVATVSSSGVVTAVRNGSADIVATSGGARGEVRVDVNQLPDRLAVSPLSVTLTALGQTQPLSAAVIDASGYAISGASVSWSSSSTGVASVSSSGLVTALVNGSASITASSGGAGAAASITVSRVAASVSVSPTSATLTSTSARQTFTATVRDANGNIITGASVTWSSSNTSVATVDSSGVVTPLSIGTATITATSGGASASAAVTASLVSGSTLSVEDSHACALAGTAAYCWGWDYRGKLGSTAVADGSTRTSPASVSPPSGQSTLAFATVSVGVHLSCGLTTSGVAYCWGQSPVGDGTQIDRSVPTLVNTAQTFSQLAAGYSHACGLNSVGQVYCWGSNTTGQLGDGTTTDRLSPVLVQSSTLTFQSIAAGGHHTCAITTTGAALCWGSARYGQLGNGADPEYASTPQLVSGNYTWSSIGAGSDHTCGRTTSGNLYCWGFRDNGRIGDGAADGAHQTCTVDGVDRNCSMTPRAVAGNRSYTALDVGGAHACAIAGGAMYCWGQNTNGQLGNGTTTDSNQPADVLQSGGQSSFPAIFSSVAAGTHTTCGANSDNSEVYCWGLNSDGQLGAGLATTGPQTCAGYGCSKTPVAVLSPFGGTLQPPGWLGGGGPAGAVSPTLRPGSRANPAPAPRPTTDSGGS